MPILISSEKLESFKAKNGKFSSRANDNIVPFDQEVALERFKIQIKLA